MPEHGEISTQETQYQIQVNYSCDVGYELNTTENNKVCHSDRQWFPDENVTCQSMFETKQRLFEHYFYFSHHFCKQNKCVKHIFEFNNFEICTKAMMTNLRQIYLLFYYIIFSLIIPVIHCPALEVPEHGNTLTEETQYQVQVNYSCDVGYELNTTENSKVCQFDRQWLPDESVSCQSMFDRKLFLYG